MRITKTTNPFPHLLHIDRNTRKTFATRYYSTSSITCDSWVTAKAWLEAVEPAHTHFITNEVVYQGWFVPDPSPIFHLVFDVEWGPRIHLRVGAQMPTLTFNMTEKRVAVCRRPSWFASRQAMVMPASLGAGPMVTTSAAGATGAEIEIEVAGMD